MRDSSPCDCGSCPAPNSGVARMEAGVPAPRCELPRGSWRHHPCQRPAVMRVLVAHYPGAAKYENRCGVHGQAFLRDRVASVWDPVRWSWEGHHIPPEHRRS